MILFASRWQNHAKLLRRSNHPCTGLQNSFNKYGLELLSFNIIESFEKEADEQKKLEQVSLILKKEKDFWNKVKNSGVKVYNAEPTGTGSVYHSDQTRKKLAEANYRRYGISEEERREIQQKVDYANNIEEAIQKTGLSIYQLKKRNIDISNFIKKRNLSPKKPISCVVCGKEFLEVDKWSYQKTTCSDICLKKSNNFIFNKPSKQDLEDLFRRGLSFKQIGEFYNCNNQSIRNFAKKYDIRRQDYI